MTGKGRTKRRRKHERFVAGFQQIQNEGQGVWDMCVVYPDNLPAIIEAGARGDRSMAVLYDLVMQATAGVRRAKPPALCLLCDHAFTRDMPAAFVVVMAGVE